MTFDAFVRAVIESRDSARPFVLQAMALRPWQRGDDAQRTRPDGGAYASAAADLASRFADNFTQYSDLAAPDVRAAGPKPA